MREANESLIPARDALQLCRVFAILSAVLFAVTVAGFFIVLPGERLSIVTQLGDLAAIPMFYSLVFWAACLALLAVVPQKRPLVLWTIAPPVVWAVILVAAVIWEAQFGAPPPW